MSVITIKIYVPELTSVLSLYDRIAIQRSEDGPPNYADAVDIAATSPTHAELVGTEESVFPGLHGTQLKMKVDLGPERTITFTGTDPVSIEEVLREVLAAIPGITAVNTGGKLDMATVSTGTAAVLEITSGTALTILGFTAGQKINGQSFAPQMTTGVDTYTFLDESGLVTNYYRTRYYNSVSEEYSSYSDWVLGSTGTVIDTDLLITGTIKMANIDGTALVGHMITVVNVFSPLISGGYFLAGSNKAVVTDGTGQAQIVLVKGSTVDVVLEGTSIIRRITVPSTGTTFDLLDPTLQTDDPFGIQVPDLPAAVRHS